MDRDQLRRVVKQHAETSRLLGVDFVPVFRAEGTELVGEDSGTVEEAVVETSRKKPVEVMAVAKEDRKPVAKVAAPAGVRSRDSVRAVLDEILERYETDAPHKAFKTAHNRIVFDDGDCMARLMFVGEAPGEDEDIQGKPFVGRGGQLLNKMISAMGLTREVVYVANVLKTRPPDNATPTLPECRLCESYLFEQIQAVRPEAIVTLGLTASRVVLKSVALMSTMRGNWHSFALSDGTSIPVMPTYHPAYLLRAYTPENREKVWSDMKQVLEQLGLSVPATSAANPS